MAAELDHVAHLAARLKELRERFSPWDALTQAQLATAFAAESPVAGATISAWESATNPKTPTATRLDAYLERANTRARLEALNNRS